MTKGLSPSQYRMWRSCQEEVLRHDPLPLARGTKRDYLTRIHELMWFYANIYLQTELERERGRMLSLKSYLRMWEAANE